MPKPGSRSNATLFVTATWTILFLVILIGGHVLLGLLLWHLSQGDGDTAKLAARTGLHDWLIWLWIAAALVMDLWILYYTRQQRKKAARR